MLKITIGHSDDIDSADAIEESHCAMSKTKK